MSIKAEIIADSISPTNCRLTTFVIVFPRIVLAELNTHRALSKNSASSRAIPFEKMLDMVKTNPFIPIRFQKEHKGMQGTEYYEGEEHEQCVADWLNARDAAVKAATSFRLPVTKQLRNRLLEPFLWHTVILTASEFGNFFALRAHPDAEIHIAKLAEEMLKAYNESEPKSLEIGDFHIPFGDKINEEKLWLIHPRNPKGFAFAPDASEKDIRSTLLGYQKIKVAIARCARVSYLNYEGKDDYAADIKLCDRLFGSAPRHLSPTEHVAQCTGDTAAIGNFRGWKQYRYFFPDQNLEDPRIVKKTWKKTS